MDCLIRDVLGISMDSWGSDIGYLLGSMEI